MPLEVYALVDDPAALDEWLERLDDLALVGVDVERADWQRYWRTAALIQVGGNGKVALIDPLALSDLSPLSAFLAGRVAVLHAMSNDVAPLASAGVELTQARDTSVAAAMLGLPTGLETLLTEVLDLELAGDKAAMQRADWEQRPLSEKMLEYAADDVAYLPALWHELERRLVAAGRLHWYRQEMEALRSQPPSEDRRRWVRTKGVGGLDPPARARAHNLWEVREELARGTDTAPGRILSDRVLVDLAASPPRKRSELGRRGMRRQAVREFGAAVLDALHDPDLEPEPRHRPADRVPDDEERALVDRLRSLRSKRADELGLNPGVLCPSRVLMGAVLAEPAAADELREALGLRPWQWEQVGGMFCEALGLAMGTDDVGHHAGSGKPPHDTAEREEPSNG